MSRCKKCGHLNAPPEIFIEVKMLYSNTEVEDNLIEVVRTKITKTTCGACFNSEYEPEELTE